jgi:galactose mutarotase-like enzyme
MAHSAPRNRGNATGMSENLVEISAGPVTARIAPKGAELAALRIGERDLIWRPDPQWWASTAPILFPVVGKSPGGQIRLAGKAYPMNPHGFVRDRVFEIVARDAARVVLETTDDAATRESFPFAFALRLEFAARDGKLFTTASIANRDAVPFPFAFGYHPAFVWPLDPARRAKHVCLFEKDETAPVRRASQDDGLLRAAKYDTPVKARRLAPANGMFVEGAFHFETLNSRRVWFGVEGEIGIDVAFPDSPQLGIWTKPGAPYLCIEPWQGLAEQAGADGELANRPGSRILAAGDIATYRLDIGLS